MKLTIKTSEFGNCHTDIYLYESPNQTNRVILLLKGMYGYHAPLEDLKTDLAGLNWDHSFIRFFSEYAHVVCMNTSRTDGFDQTQFKERRNSFEGKNFQTELSDVEIAFKRTLEILSEKGITKPEIHLVGKSLGGTTFFGLPELVSKSNTVSFIGTSCSKSETTTKPLLQTMFSEEKLFETFKSYDGNICYFRGGSDETVPLESTEKVISHLNAKVLNYVTLRGVDHEFDKIDGVDSPEPSGIVRKMILNMILAN